MTLPLVVLATLAACLAGFAIAYALGARQSRRLFITAGVLIVLVAAGTLAAIVVRDMRAGTGLVGAE